MAAGDNKSQGISMNDIELVCMEYSIAHTGIVNSLWPISVNFGPFHGLLPDGTKPLPGPMFTDLQRDLTNASAVNDEKAFEDILIMTIMEFS